MILKTENLEGACKLIFHIISYYYSIQKKKKVTRRGARTHDHKIKSLALYQTELGGLDNNFAEMRECIFVCFGENQYERYLERFPKEIDKLIGIFSEIPPSQVNQFRFNKRS
jgi:hypothetical protein